jgi:pre-mRNA-splicing factor SPF27
MSLTPAIHESLPYIDTEPTPQERAAAQKLIDQELTLDPPSSSEKHTNLPEVPPSNLSPAILAEFARIESKKPLKAIDTSRYEALDPPSTTTKDAESLEAWRESLKRAYISASYLSQRQTNLALLEKYGKNGWLIGNSQLEDVLRGMERELAERKAEIDGVVVERKTAQENVGGELKSLEETWKRGVGRVLETEVAAESVR